MWEDAKATGALGNNNNTVEAQTSTSDFGSDTYYAPPIRKLSVTRLMPASSLLDSDRGATPMPAKIPLSDGTTVNDAGASKATLRPERPQPVALQSHSSSSHPQAQPSHQDLWSPQQEFPAVTQNANSFLLVDDNAINLKVMLARTIVPFFVLFWSLQTSQLTATIPVQLQILASYMKKLGRRHDNAMNGLEALEACRSRRTHYKCIFMGKSRP